MKFRARLKRLAADVHWLKFDGALNGIERQARILEMMRAIDLAKRRQAEAARRPKRIVVRPAPAPAAVVQPPPLPPPLPVVPPAPPKPVEPAYVPPLVEPFVPNVPDHMLRPVQWRIRGPDDYDWAREGTEGRCLTEYDPLADLDDDDS